MEFISRLELEQSVLIDQEYALMYQEFKDRLEDLAGGRIFSVEFVKKNGEERRMVCRFGVKAHLVGEKEFGISRSQNMLRQGYLTVFDMHKVEYRSVNISTLKWIKVAGITIEMR